MSIILHYSKKDGNHIYLSSNKRKEFFRIAFIQIKTKNFTWLECGEWDFENSTMNIEVLKHRQEHKKKNPVYIYTGFSSNFFTHYQSLFIDYQTLLSS